MVADLPDRTRVVTCGGAAVAGMGAEKVVIGAEGVDDHLEPRSMRFVDQPAAAVRRFEADFPPPAAADCRANAQRFSTERFHREWAAFVARAQDAFRRRGG